MTKKHPLPKRLLGVKIPKGLRNLDWATRFLESEIGRQILADALVAAAAAASAALVAAPSGVSAKAGKKLSRASSKGGDLVKNVARNAAVAMVETIANAAWAASDRGAAVRGKSRNSP
jgi:hypothetical protein